LKKTRKSNKGRANATAIVVVVLTAVIAFVIGIFMALDENDISPSSFKMSGADKRAEVSSVKTASGQYISSQNNKVEEKSLRGKRTVKKNHGKSGERKSPPVRIGYKEPPGKNNAHRRPKDSERRGNKPPLPDINRTTTAKVALVIDDFGNNMKFVDEFCDMEIPVTLAILPYLANSKKIARQATASGKAVILHLPMENRRGINPGPGTLRVDMEKKDLIQEFKMDLSFVPGADGFNNHEGSLATENEEMMSEILKVAKEKNLFFLDSMTSSKSVGVATASRLGVPALGRSVFLDNEDDFDYICGQLEQLTKKALANGSAVGIGHVRKNTYQAIVKMIPDMQKKGVEFVFVKELIK